MASIHKNRWCRECHLTRTHILVLLRRRRYLYCPACGRRLEVKQ